MPTGTRPRRGRRTPLNRERIIGAAYELAVDGGLEAVTMQAIGQRLGVEAMSLYRHVDSKDGILDGLVDLVISGIERPDAADWRTAMRRRATSARSVFAEHRWAIGLIESRTRPGAATLRHHEWVLRTLLDAGFPWTLATHAYNLLDSYVYGFAMQEASLPFDSLEGQAEVGQRMLEQLEEYPVLAAVTREFLASGQVYLSEFEFGLDLILDGLEQHRALVSGATRGT